MITHEHDTVTTEDELLLRAVARLNANVCGLVLGAMAGVLLMVLTLVLIAKGGENVGQHLSLLGHFFPGYAVSLGGAFVGLLWGFVAGYVAGAAIGWVYNRIVAGRHAN